MPQFAHRAGGIAPTGIAVNPATRTALADLGLGPRPLQRLEALVAYRVRRVRKRSSVWDTHVQVSGVRSRAS